MKRCVLLITLFFSVMTGYRLMAAIPSSGYFTMDQLAEAQAEAAANNQPILWVMILDGDMDPSNHKYGARLSRSLLEYIAAHIKDRTIVVLINGNDELRNLVPPSVRDAAYNGDNGEDFFVPRVALTSPDAQVVLGIVTEEEIGKEGIRPVEAALNQVENSPDLQKKVRAGSDNFNFSATSWGTLASWGDQISQWDLRIKIFSIVIIFNGIAYGSKLVWSWYRTKVKPEGETTSYDSMP